MLSTHELDMALQTADRIWLMRPVDAPHGERKSSIVSGIPESLVLDGQLEQAFRRKGFEFDLHSGSFRFRHDAERTIGLVGDGVRAYWARRALERIGCRWCRERQPRSMSWWPARTEPDTGSSLMAAPAIPTNFRLFPTC